MMPQRLTVKRRPVRKRAVRTLFANVARKKKRQRATTAAPPAEFESDVPNLGIARALVVILVIHVVAIAGIFVHSRWIDKTAVVTAEEAESTAVVEVAVEPVESTPLPIIRESDRMCTVGAGDTYEILAERNGVTEDELRLANDNIPLRAGRRLRVPPKTIVATEPPELAELRSRPAAAPQADPAPAMPELVETVAAERADARMVRPQVAAPAAGSSSYVVKSGDTFWGIAHKHGTTVDAVMKANGITDPRRLRSGMTLVIPR